MTGKDIFSVPCVTVNLIQTELQNPDSDVIASKIAGLTIRYTLDNGTGMVISFIKIKFVDYKIDIKVNYIYYFLFWIGTSIRSK